MLAPKWYDGILECTPGMAGDGLHMLERRDSCNASVTFSLWYETMQGLE